MKKVVAIVCALALLLTVTPSFSKETLPNPESLRDADLGAIVGGLGSAECIGIIIGLSLGFLVGAAVTGGVLLALAGAYLPIAAAAC